MPQDGDNWDDQEPEEADEGDDEGQKLGEKPAPQVSEEAKRIASLEAQIEALKGQIPPPRRAEPAIVEEKDPFDEVDWDQELFQNPKAALKKAVQMGAERAARAVETKLRGEYQQDRNQTRFWDRFYAANPDLEKDDDLVRATLSANMGKLGGMAIPDAVEQLGALTRQRIAGYVDRATKGRAKKATVEGAGTSLPNSRVQQQQRQEPPQTLSQIMKVRRAKRARAA